jgi:uncharacterized RDD family membrane protein YckC
MDISEIPASQTPDGYLSEQGKRRFTITAGILGAVFFMAQIALPFVLMLIAMPTMILKGDLSKRLNVDSMVLWNDSIWFIEESKKTKHYNLKRITLREFGAPETVCRLLLDKPSLLAGKDTLWIISPNFVTQYTDSGLGKATRIRYAGNTSKPFLLHNLPAVVKDAPDETSVLVYENGTWQRKYGLDLVPKSKKVNIATDLQVLCDESQMHLFMQMGFTVYYKSYPFDSIIGNTEPWEAVGSVGTSWKAVSNGVDLFVFGIWPIHRDRPIAAYRKKDNTWEMFFKHQVSFSTDMGVCSLPETERFIVSTQTFPNSVSMLEIEGADIIKSKSFGSVFPFGAGFPLLFIIPYSSMLILPFILAIILSAMMRKHRICRHVAESHELPYASLTRRAFAQAVDALILGAPFIVSFIFMMIMFMNPNILRSNSTRPIMSPLLMCAGFPWAIIWLLIYSATEGASGATPGKWLFGIRVMGTDLRPCGFGRAFVRNILKFVDGFFNFMVGVMVAALSHNWQRVGDMAARTVVVDIRTNKNKKNIYEANVNGVP